MSVQVFLAGVFLSLALGASTQAGVTEREIVRVRSEYFLARQDLANAEAVLRAHLGEDPEDPDGRARLAEILVINLRPLEALGEIEKAFSLIDSRNWKTPERVKWTSLKAQILWSLKRRVDAEHALKSLDVHAEYAEWLTEVRSRMAKGDLSLESWPLPQPSSTNWALQGQLNLGRDSNFGFVSDPIATSLEEDEDSSFDSLYGEGALALARVRENTERSQQARFSLGYRQYVTEEARYYNSLTPVLSFFHSAIPQDPFFAWISQHSAQIQANFLNLNGMQLYLLGADIRPGLRRVSGPRGGLNLQLIFQYNAYGADYSGEGSENRAGLNAGGAFQLDRRWGGFGFSWGVQGLRLQPSGSSYQGYSVMMPVVANWSSESGAWGFELSSNPSERIYSGGTEGRRDRWLDGRLSLHQGWSRNTRVGIDTAWLKNNSNQDDYDFTKTEVSFFVRHQF
jgi:hypothetical protein